MAKTPYAARIRARINEIEKMLASMDSLRAELAELRVAEKVLGRLASDENDSEVSSANDSEADSALTVRDAIVNALTSCAEPWQTTLDIKRLVEGLMGREVSIGTVGPNLTRLKKDGVIERDGAKVALRIRVEKVEAPAFAEAPKQSVQAGPLAKDGLTDNPADKSVG